MTRTQPLSDPRRHSKLHLRLLTQCLLDAKLGDNKNYSDLLDMPDSYIRTMLGSLAAVMDQELKNLEKRMVKRIKGISLMAPSGHNC